MIIWDDQEKTLRKPPPQMHGETFGSGAVVWIVIAIIVLIVFCAGASAGLQLSLR